MITKLEWLICVHCSARYIEECVFAGVDLEGSPELPERCYRVDLIRMTPKPHKNEIE